MSAMIEITKFTYNEIEECFNQIFLPFTKGLVPVCRGHFHYFSIFVFFHYSFETSCEHIIS